MIRKRKSCPIPMPDHQAWEWGFLSGGFAQGFSVLHLFSVKRTKIAKSAANPVSNGPTALS